MIVFDNPNRGKGVPRQFRVLSGPHIANDGLKTEYYVCINHNGNFTTSKNGDIIWASSRCRRTYVWPTHLIPKEVRDKL